MAKKTNFEKNMNELTDIVYKMENDDIDIDESVKLYKKGMTLAKTLSKSLNDIEEEVLILKNEVDGTFTLEKNSLE